jgi:hypothetical protein
MTMIPYDPAITRALRWQQNKAPRITSVLNQKQQWYDRYNTQFWEQWRTGIFDLRTANPFGLAVWCIILGLPLDIFNFEPLTNAWAYGIQRGNYIGPLPTLPLNVTTGPTFYANGVVDPTASLNAATGHVHYSAPPPVGAALSWSAVVTESGGDITFNRNPIGVGDGVQNDWLLLDPAHFNDVGYNFQGGGDQSVSLLSDVRYACQLRYVALVSNGSQQWINQMLKYIFNNNEDWDFAGKKYFYLTDATEDGSVLADMTMQYHIGANMPLSAQFINLLNNRQYGITPQLSGVPYTVIQDP